MTVQKKEGARDKTKASFNHYSMPHLSLSISNK